MFLFLVTLGWSLIIIGAIVQIFTAILNFLVIQSATIPSILNSMNNIFQTSIFKKKQILSYLTGDIWEYTIIALTIFVALLVITLVSAQLHRVKKRQLIAKPYIKMIFVTLIIAALIYGKVAVLILAALMFIGLLFVESSLFDVESLQNFAEERNMIVIYHQDKKIKREVNKEEKYHGSVTLGVDVTIAGARETERDLKNNDYAKENDSKKLSYQKSNSIFSSNKLNNLFNYNKNDVDEHELANLINYMTQNMTDPQKSAVFETKLNTAETYLKQSKSKELSKPPVVNEVKQQEKSNLRSEQLEDQNSANDARQNKRFEEIPAPFLVVKPNADYNFNADIKIFSDKTSAVKENADFNEAEDKKPNFSFLDDEFKNSSRTLEKSMTIKQKKLYNKWSKMHQQALNIKQMVEEEVEIAQVKHKLIKKKAKIYNVISKQANGLVRKLKLELEYELKLMCIAEIFSNNSQATVNFLNNQILATDNNVIDNVLNDNINESSENIILEINTFNNVVDNDKTKKEIEIMNNNIKIANQESQRTRIIFIPSDHNIDKLKKELLPDIKTSDNEETKTDNVPYNYNYPFAEIAGLDDSQSGYLDKINSVANEDNYDEEIQSSEKNKPSDLSVEQKIVEQIKNNKATPVEDEILKTNEVKPEYKVKNDAINLELIPELLDTTEPNNAGTDMFNIPMNEKENTILTETRDSAPAEIFTTDIKGTNQSEVNANELNKNKVEYHQDQLLYNVVTNKKNKLLQSEILPILKYEVSYSLDELDDKIMNGDFSNLDDEVIEYFNQEKTEPIKETPFVEEARLQQVISNDFEYRFKNIEEIIKDSINLHTTHTKKLREVQIQLKNLTLKVEALEAKSLDFSKKNNDVENKKYIKHHGVVPIDQLYPQISDTKLVSTRYNLYNKKEYSNTYGVAKSSENLYGLGNYYRTKNSSSSQEEIKPNNNQFTDYNHLNLHNISKYTKQDIPFEINCPFCKKNNK